MTRTWLIFIITLKRMKTKVSCAYCGEMIWQEFYIEDGKKQDVIIDCEVCCRPNRYIVDFSDPHSPIVQVEQS